VHAKGLKLGLYTDAGLYTCSQGGRDHPIPGSYGYYKQDANTYAGWGLDYVKMDWCNTNVNGTQLDPKIQYPQMAAALNQTGRPIFFALCEWGVENPWEWAMPYGNSWRTGGDHHDSWDSTGPIIEHNAGLSKYAAPGGWNDLDFLMTGGQGCKSNPNKICPGMTHTEYKTEFSLWALMNSPLLVATDIRTMDSKKKEILMNSEIIAINQDSLAKPGDRIGFWDCNHSGKQDCQIWAKPLADGTYAVILYNSGNNAHNITADFGLIGWNGATVLIRDLWAHEYVGTFTGNYTSEVKSHGVAVLKAIKKSSLVHA